MSENNNLQFVKDNFAITNKWIELADKKATFILTVTLALFTLSLTMAPDILAVIVEQIKSEQIYQLFFGFVLIALSITYVVTVILALVTLLDIISPKLDPYSKRNSVLFFHTIAKMEMEDFKNKISSFKRDDVRDKYLDQTYNNSIITSKKFKKIHRSICCLKLAGSLGLILIFIGIIFKINLS